MVMKRLGRPIRLLVGKPGLADAPSNCRDRRPVVARGG